MKVYVKKGRGMLGTSKAKEFMATMFCGKNIIFIYFW
jgi:hypothetical protein